MKKWALVLHLYQPPTQEAGIVREVLRSCYIPILRLINDIPGIEVTLNISGGLIQQIEDLGDTSFRDLVRKAVNDGKVELLNSPIYHTIIPLTPQEVVDRQLKKNAELVEKFAGKIGEGIFPPELAVNEKSITNLENYGKYVIVDQSAINKPGLAMFRGVKLVAGNSKLCEILRTYPEELSTKQVVSLVENSKQEAVISIHDAEIFGHHYSERINLFEGILKSSNIKFVSVSHLIESKKALPNIDSVSESTWQVKDKFATWAGNDLQKMYITLAEQSHALWKKYSRLLSDNALMSATDHLDRGFASCHLYWLSNDPWWNPDLVGRGAENLIRCVRILPCSKNEKMEAETMYHDFLTKMWKYHWSGKVEEGFLQYDLFFRDWIAKIRTSLKEPID
jgi:alpha-amylase/alpha-mannosidase (GH57 family)